MLLQDGEAPRRVTNVRDDKILTSRFWTPSFQQRRCLVPASSYPSTINGNAKRGTGLLNNELYVGRLIWNRLRYMKDPSTGRLI